MAITTTKASKEGKAKPKKATSAPKKPRAYPPYSEMINEAITALKERTGSSQIAIAKFIEEKQKDNLPTNFKKLLLVQLKKLVANGKLVKVKNSFKLPPKSPSTAAAAAAKKPKSATTKDADKKPKSSSTNAAAKKPKSSTAGARKPKSSTTRAAAKKPKASSGKVADKKPKAKAKEGALKSPGKKAAVVAKAKKPKTIKSPAKKVVVKKGKK